MASAEHLLISKVIQSNDIVQVLEAGVKPQHFSAYWENVWQWLLKYWRDHNAIPSIRAFAQEFADIKLVDAEREQFSNLLDEMFLSYRHQTLLASLATAVPMLNVNKTDEALHILVEGVQTASADISRLRDVDLIQTWESRIERYELMRNTPNAIRGIPTGFNGLDRITSGLRPQQLVTCVGEAQKGKSLIT